MEALTKHEIAKRLGVDHTRVRGAQDWVPDTHPHLRISQLVLDHPTDPNDVEIHPFRVHDRRTGKTHTRIKGEHEDHIVDHAKVKAIHDATVAQNQMKNLKIVPEIYKAIPELDPENAHKHPRIGDFVYDLVDGKLTNARTPAIMPAIFVDENDELVVDVCDLADHHQQAVHSALSAKMKVTAQRAKG